MHDCFMDVQVSDETRPQLFALTGARLLTFVNKAMAQMAGAERHQKCHLDDL